MEKTVLSLIVMAIMPIAFGLGIFLFFGLLRLICPAKNAGTTIRNTICTLTVMIFLIHPTITNQSFNLFSCYEVDGHYYLITEFAIECYTKEHYMILLKYGAPILIVWVVGFPALIFYLLYMHRHSLDDKDTIIKYGIFYIGLTDKMFYWEVIIVNIRKILFICIIISLKRSSS